MTAEKHANDAERAALENLAAKSAGTDIPILLQAKETAKRLVRDDPTPSNLAALQRADAMLEAAMQKQNNDKPTILKTVPDVLLYLQDHGKQIQKSKLYDDISRGLLKKTDGQFRLRDVARYGGSLPLSTTPDGRNIAAEDRLKRKEEAEIRIKEATAEREEIKTKVMRGEFVAREQVEQELAARAMALHSGLKSQVEAAALDLVALVDGNPAKNRRLTVAVEQILDDAAAEYSRAMEFEVIFDDGTNDNDGGET